MIFDINKIMLPMSVKLVTVYYLISSIVLLSCRGSDVSIFGVSVVYRLVDSDAMAHVLVMIKHATVLSLQLYSSTSNKQTHFLSACQYITELILLGQQY